MARQLLTLIVLAAAAAGFLMHDVARANMAPPIDDFRAGLTLETTATGAKVLTVEKGEAADRVGVKPGDVILAIDHRYARSLSEAELKSFAEELHLSPIGIILVRDCKDVLELRLAH